MAVRRLAEQQPASFAFTPDNEAWAKTQIAKYPPGRQASAVIALLWRAQAQNDYWLPRPAIEKVADMLAMPYIRVLEIATFYSMFNLAPVGKHLVQVCGTTPCVLRGAETLKQICATRIGAERQVGADGVFSWTEVECLGACCNAPMVQIDDDYYEDLTPETFNRLLDDLAAGRSVKKGSQTGRVSSEPEPGKGTTLTDPQLYDGSVVGAWRKRFDEETAKVAAAAAAKAEADRAAKAAAEAAAAPVPSAEVKPAAPQAPVAAPVPPAPAVPAAEPAPSVSAAPPARPVPAAAPPAAAAAPEPESPPEAAVLTPAQQATEETLIAAKLVSLPPNATPEQKANAVGDRPAGLAAPRGRADDLKRIRGIGPVNEGKLNGLGIFHYDQIAGWSRAEIRWVGTYLAFPGRIDREKWVEQAVTLAGGGAASPAQPRKDR